MGEIQKSLTGEFRELGVAEQGHEHADLVEFFGSDPDYRGTLGPWRG
jgi:hypothetical protein